MGLDAAGKTTILYQMKTGEKVNTMPTIGFNVEDLKFGKMHMTAWDIGHRDSLRPLLRHYYPNTNALIFVIDSNDVERMEEAIDYMKPHFMEDELRDCPVLIMANKQDLDTSLSTIEIIETNKLGEVLRGRTWRVSGCSGTTGEGLVEAFEWLSEKI